MSPSDFAVETDDLTHRFGRDATVLDGLALQVPTGAIYGFLGPNGAGKTTTLRLLLGLLTRQSGTICLFGQPQDHDREAALRRVGSCIEQPSIFGHLTALENLRVWQPLYRVPDRRLTEVLDLVGLAETGRKRAGAFSLGMKQRLGLAIALLHQPGLLILDEPTNGLDPEGIIELRGLLQQLNREHGLTLLVSSHLLDEVERLATVVGVLHRGRLVFQGSAAALSASQRDRAGTVLGTSDDARAIGVLAARGITATPVAEGLRLPQLDPGARGRVVRALVLEGLDVHHLADARPDLEQTFLDLVRN